MFIFVEYERWRRIISTFKKEPINKGPKATLLEGAEKSSSFIQKNVVQDVIGYNKPKKANINVIPQGIYVIIVLPFRQIVHCE
jgi:hypothetical protein